MTLPEGQTQVIAHDQSISFIRCLFSAKSTEPLYKSAWVHIVIITNIQYTCMKCKTRRA